MVLKSGTNSPQLGTHSWVTSFEVVYPVHGGKWNYSNLRQEEWRGDHTPTQIKS